MKIVTVKKLTIDLTANRALAMIDVNFSKARQLLTQLNSFGKELGLQKIEPKDLYYLNPLNREGERARGLIRLFEDELVASIQSSRRLVSMLPDKFAQEAAKARIDEQMKSCSSWTALLEMSESERAEYIKARDKSNSSYDSWFKAVYIKEDPAIAMSM